MPKYLFISSIQLNH